MVIQYLLQWFDQVNPLLTPFYFLLSWGLIIALVLGIANAVKNTINKARLMHKIPCSNCQYFTNNPRLKCTVNPHIANTELAINCYDFQE